MLRERSGKGWFMYGRFVYVSEFHSRFPPYSTPALWERPPARMVAAPCPHIIRDHLGTPMQTVFNVRPSVPEFAMATTSGPSCGVGESSDFSGAVFQTQ